MSRFASAPWPLRAVYVGVLAAAAVAILATITVVVALAGLKRLSADIHPATLPTWFWYFRGDPLVRRWLGVGLASASGVAAVVAIAVLRSRRPPLHGAARWASEAELVQAGCGASRASCSAAKAGGTSFSAAPSM